MTNTYKISLKEKLRIYAHECTQELFYPMVMGLSPLERIRYEAIPMAQYKIRKAMRERAVQLPEARFVYNNHSCYFNDGVVSGYRLMLELPLKDEDSQCPTIKYILATDDKERKVIAALAGHTMHREIVRTVEETTSSRLHHISGGKLSITKTFARPMKIEVFGSSGDYGQANHDEVVQVLRLHGLEARVREEQERNDKDKFEKYAKKMQGDRI